MITGAARGRRRAAGGRRARTRATAPGVTAAGSVLAVGPYRRAIISGTAKSSHTGHGRTKEAASKVSARAHGRRYVGPMDLVAVGKRRYRKLKFLGDLIRAEHKGAKKMEVPLSTRLRAWRHGFLGVSAGVYDLAHNDWHEFLSDYDYYLKTPFINYGRYNLFLNDKLFFYCAMKAVGAPTPTIYGSVADAGIAWLNAPAGIDGSSGFGELLEQERDVVLKPVNGGGGSGVSFVTYADGSLRVNGTERDLSFVQGLLVRGILICERIHQADYAARINPLGTNTVRIVTMWDPGTDEPFIARAAHRFATQRSLPVDNFGRGGLSADVDVESGRLGPGIAFPYDGHLRRHRVHPDSAAQIEGVTVPGWSGIRERILGFSGRLPQLPLVGWDVVVTEGGMSVIEGNSYPNPDVLQIHRPLLDDPRVRRFYRHHGVLA